MVLDAVCKSIVIFFTSTDSSSRRRSLKFSSDIQKALECAICFKIKTTQKASFMMGIHPFLVLLSISVSMHLLVQRLFFKVAWILQQNFIAILWQYWWTIFLRKAILAPSHSKHVINMCRCDQGRRKKKKTFVTWNEYSFKCFLASLPFDSKRWFENVHIFYRHIEPVVISENSW